MYEEGLTTESEEASVNLEDEKIKFLASYE